MKDTFTLWAHQDKTSGEIVWTGAHRHSRADARWLREPGTRVVKLECRIVHPQRKPKRGTYPNDNFGLPAGYTPHNPDNLTREQVGEGFRLLATVEIWRRNNRDDIQAWLWHDKRWQPGKLGRHRGITYRVPINTPLDINPELKTK